MGNTIRTAISRRLTLCRETFILLSHFESTERIRGLSNLSKTIWIVKQESIHVFHSKSIQSLLGQLGVIFAILENIKGWLNGIWASPEFTCNAGDTGDMGLIPGPRRSLEEGMATHYSILAWRAPWIEEPGRLHYIGSQRVRCDWSNWARAHTHTHTHTHVCTHACTCVHTRTRASANTHMRAHTHKEYTKNDGKSSMTRLIC